MGTLADWDGWERRTIEQVRTVGGTDDPHEKREALTKLEELVEQASVHVRKTQLEA